MKITVVWAVIMAAAGLALAGCASGGGAAVITECGSTTVQPLAEKLGASFTAEHPDIEITIQGGGSSVGIKSASNGLVDIGASSRELRLGDPELEKHLLARDGIAIIVHPTSGLTGLTGEQLRQIFAGEITNWSAVGGADEDIMLVSREEGSGTRDAFNELVMVGNLVAVNAILQPSNGAMRTTVASMPGSIGYLSFGYLDSAVKALTIDGVQPSVDNVLNETYPVARPLYFLTKEPPRGDVKLFIDYCRSAGAQSVIEDEGYISVYGQ